MQKLAVHRATPEQLPIISATRMGVEVIRGAAGSGKTTTALLRLESLAHTFVARQLRLGLSDPVKILVLTFNRTLAGYVEGLAESQLVRFKNIEYSVKTFSAWAREEIGVSLIIEDCVRERFFRENAGGINLPVDFLLHEIDYVCGRFPQSQLDRYLTVERTGRGISPQVGEALRFQILALIRLFYRFLESHQGGLSVDWHLLAERMLAIDSLKYDIVVVDEAQDFSANQLRAINHHLAEQHCVTLVMDTVQRLYPRGFTWLETGLDMTSARYHRLKFNHRNTREIAMFAAGILDGLGVDDDGTAPSNVSGIRSGTCPLVCRGLYNRQLEFALNWVANNVDLNNETVAFLKPKGGHWFDEVKNALYRRGLPFVEITQSRDWPKGFENIILSTMHSSKGLEFDHVIILGLSTLNTSCIDDIENDEQQVLRRLLAMAIARARHSVILGYKPTEASNLVRFFSSGTYNQIDV